MPRPPWNLFGRLVRRLPAGDPDQVPDADLLARFVRDRDPSAFELLVWRHGGLVLGTCRRILRDEHLAEDAFQATFLVLARKAGGVRGENVAGWLHRVARRVAVRAAKKRAKVAARETGLNRETAIEPAVADRDWAGKLDAEVGRLPERFRQPVILCYFQDYTTEEAARVLGVPRGTVLSRLSTARERLSARLTRRGVTLPAALVSASVASNQLVSATVRSAAAFAFGEAVLTSAPTILATEVIRMSAWKLPAAVAAAMVLTVSVGSGVAWVQGGGGQGNGPVVAGQSPAKGSEAPKEQSDGKKQQDNEKQRVREVLLGKREDIEKQINKLNTSLRDKYKQMRETSLEDFPAIQQRYTDLGRQMAQSVRDLKESEFNLKQYDQLNKDLKEVLDKESASDKDVRIDTNTRDGLRLQAYYKQQIEAETKLKEIVLTHAKDHPSIQVQQKLLDGLSENVAVIEKRFRSSIAREKYDAANGELTRKKLYEENRRKFLSEHVRMLEYNMDKDLKLGIQIGTMTDEYTAIKNQLADWNNQLAEIERSIKWIEMPARAGTSPNERIDEVLLELTKLRKDVADLKQAARK